MASKNTRTPYMREYRVNHTAVNVNRETHAELTRLKSKYKAPNTDEVIKKLITESND